MKSFMVVRAGNSVRIRINFEVRYIFNIFGFCYNLMQAELRQGYYFNNKHSWLYLKQASPRPTIVWSKDNMPVTKRATISNSDDSSQLLIPSSERSDSGIYSVLVKNLAGQETCSTEVRVTGKAKSKISSAT